MAAVLVPYARFLVRLAMQYAASHACMTATEHDYMSACKANHMAEVVPLFPGLSRESVTCARNAALTEPSRQASTGAYPPHPPVVGPLADILATAERYYAQGVKTGLTRLRAGVWQLVPRGQA